MNSETIECVSQDKANKYANVIRSWDFHCEGVRNMLYWWELPSGSWDSQRFLGDLLSPALVLQAESSASTFPDLCSPSLSNRYVSLCFVVLNILHNFVNQQYYCRNLKKKLLVLGTQGDFCFPDRVLIDIGELFLFTYSFLLSIFSLFYFLNFLFYIAV